MFSTRQDWSAVTAQLNSCGHYLPTYPQPDPQLVKPKPNKVDLMMELVKAQMATIGTLKNSQTKQDDMIMQLRRDVERLTELVCVMKPTN